MRIGQVIWPVAGPHASVPDPNDPNPATRPMPGAYYSCTTHGVIHQLLGGSWDNDWYSPSTGSSGSLPSGTAFPGTPAADDLFYRTDRALLYSYDGTRWLTVNEYVLPITTRTAVAGGYTATSTIGNAPTRASAGDMFVEDLRVAAFLSVTGATASNRWAVTLEKRTAANVGTTIGTVTIDSQAGDTWAAYVDAIDELVAGGSHLAFQALATKTGSPGALLLGIEITYRFVG